MLETTGPTAIATTLWMWLIAIIGTTKCVTNVSLVITPFVN